MQPIVVTKQLAAPSATAICLNQTPGAAGSLTLNGASVSGGVATLDTQRRVLITSVGNDSGITFTVRGTNDANTAISEVVAGANAGTAVTNQDFKTVTSIANSGAVAAGGVSVGTNGTGSTPWFVPDPHLDPTEIAASLKGVTGTTTASVEVTDDVVTAPLPIYQAGWAQTPPVPTPFAWVGLSAVATSAGSLTTGVINRNCGGIRLTVTGGVGQVLMTLRQSGITGP